MGFSVKRRVSEVPRVVKRIRKITTARTRRNLFYLMDLLYLFRCSTRSRLSAPLRSLRTRPLTHPFPPSHLSCGASIAQPLLNVRLHEIWWKRLALLGTIPEPGEGADCRVAFGAVLSEAYIVQAVSLASSSRCRVPREWYSPIIPEVFLYCSPVHLSLVVSRAPGPAPGTHHSVGSPLVPT